MTSHPYHHPSTLPHIEKLCICHKLIVFVIFIRVPKNPSGSPDFLDWGPGWSSEKRGSIDPCSCVHIENTPSSKAGRMHPKVLSALCVCNHLCSQRSCPVNLLHNIRPIKICACPSLKSNIQFCLNTQISYLF